MKAGRIYARLVTTSYLGVLAIILVAGLWPFHAPRNNVTWLAEGNGIRFGHHGTLLSAGKFPRDLTANSSGSIEMWLSPDLAARRKTILTFDGPAHPGEPFSLQQDEDALEIRRHNIDSAGVARTAVCEAGGIFRKGKAVFIAVTLSAHQTVVYVDGVRAKTCAIAGASADNLSGTVVLANSALVNNSWPGTILGLALYGRQLKPDEAAQDYESWTKIGKPALAETESPLALYRFDEHSGAVAHNQLNAATDLRIPKHYLVLHPAFLELPWREYRPRWSYWADVGVNVAGFVPWGFFVGKKNRPPRRHDCAFGFCGKLYHRSSTVLAADAKFGHDGSHHEHAGHGTGLDALSLVFHSVSACGGDGSLRRSQRRPGSSGRVGSSRLGS